jgi:two-component system chemotaxis sensor kinase CheA
MVWNKLPRVVRDIAVALGKQIRLEMEGGETELDRTIIEAIKDPLVHLVRNSCDHGIELPDVRVRAGKKPLGRLTLRAWYEGGQVNIEIGDDGAGIDMARVRKKAVELGLLRPEQAQKLSDRETLNLIFLPGFSTVQTVTNVSGRGVGMDVVKSHIEKIGGIVDAFSGPGEGTTIKIKIPGVVWGMPGAVANADLADRVLPLDQIVPEILLRVNGAPGTS